jgi:hypothetical protein
MSVYVTSMSHNIFTALEINVKTLRRTEHIKVGSLSFDVS